jgi:transcriptional regulator with XRE-family HTH domain
MGKYLESFKIKLGKKIRDRRKDVGFKSQNDLAEAIGVSRNAVAKWELGENGVDDAYIGSLKKALKVDDSFFADQSVTMAELAGLKPIPSDLELDNRALRDRVRFLEAKLDPKFEDICKALKTASKGQIDAIEIILGIRQKKKNKSTKIG